MLDADMKSDQQIFGKILKRAGVQTLKICATHASEGEKVFQYFQSFCTLIV